MAHPGIEMNIGEKNIDIRNRNPVVMAVHPVLPPAITPVELSTYVVTVETPSAAPAVVAIASAIKARPTFGTFPFSSSISAFEHTPTNVPTVSKKSTNRNVQTMTNKFPNILKSVNSLKSNFPITGIIDSYLKIPDGK